MFLQLNPPLPLETPKGKAWAVALIDYGPQWDLQWITFIHDSGECWTFSNRDIRQEANYTFGLKKPSDIHPGAMPIMMNGHGPEPMRPAVPHDYQERIKPATNGYLNGHN